MRLFLSFLLLALLSGCTTTYSNQNITGIKFPEVSGETLEKEALILPQHFAGKPALLLIGYVQNSQFDIDRWLIGLDMTETNVDVYELPTIQGLFPRMFKPMINNGMRKGIPKALWKGVITIYNDGEQVQALTGNTNPANTRVALLNNEGEIVYFYDEGFAVSALNDVREAIKQL